MKSPAVAIVALALVGCAAAPTYVLEPAPGALQDVVYNKGVASIISKGAYRTAITLLESEFQSENRLKMVVFVRNGSDDEIDVSTANITARDAATGAPLAVLSPEEVTRLQNDDRARRRTWAALAYAFGEAGGMYNPDDSAADKIRREIDLQRSKAEDAADARFDRAYVGTLLQRETVPAGGMVKGVVEVMMPASAAPVTAIEATIAVGGESHQFHLIRRVSQ